MMKPVTVAAGIAAVAAIGALIAVSPQGWRSPSAPDEAAQSEDAPEVQAAPTTKILLSDQAISNLSLRAKSARPDAYWKTIEAPGMVVDRPGRSDRGIVAPATGAVDRIDRVPGDVVKPGERLFVIRLFSESLHSTQADLFKTTQDIKLAMDQRKRLLLAAGVVAESRVIEVDQQVTRLEAAAKTHRQELLNRGLTPDQVDEVAEGKFVREIAVVVPKIPSAENLLRERATNAGSTHNGSSLEVQELKVELGQQVLAGQTLCLLADHRRLAIEGRAFEYETPFLERSVREGWPVDVDFQETPGADWPPLEQEFLIRQLANSIDPVKRTFGFVMPLENQSRMVQSDGRTQMFWRFRPGQKVRLRVRVEKLEDVFALPREAVIQDGAEAFVFTQNVNTFERKRVRVVFRDRQHAVVANDGSFVPGSFVVQNAAAQLNRMAKTQSSSVPKGYHIHADGTLHKNEDEGK